MERVIAHIDMDAFFAAVEQRDNPSLKGKPVVIGADPKGGKGRGVVSTCSYEARRFGIHSAQPISVAYRLCPQAVYLPADFKKYHNASDNVFRILSGFTPDIEPISIDEAFLDLTGCCHFYQTPFATAQAIKSKIKNELNLTASIGLAPVKMVAKIASDFSKPDGLIEVTRESLLDFLWPLPVERLWGVGAKTKSYLNRMGIHLIGDIAKLPKEYLSEHLGEHGQHLWELAQGIDPRGVEASDETKSVSHEHTFEADISHLDTVYQVLLVLSEKVSRHLRKLDLLGKTITIKIRLKGFKTYTRAITLDQRTNFVELIYKKSRELFEEFYKPGMMIRLVGVRVTNFSDPYVQDSLFSEDRNNEKTEKVHKAVDLIKNKFGDKAIHRAF